MVSPPNFFAYTATMVIRGIIYTQITTEVIGGINYAHLNNRGHLWHNLCTKYYFITTEVIRGIIYADHIIS